MNLLKLSLRMLRRDWRAGELRVLAFALVIAVGGMLFGALRLVGRNLLAPVVGHWLFDAVAMLAARLAVAL